MQTKFPERMKSILFMVALIGGLRQPLSLCLQCSLNPSSFRTKSSYLSSVFSLVSADAAKIVRSWVLLSPRLVTLPLCNKDVIEIPSQCTRNELSSTFCNKKDILFILRETAPARTCSAARLQTLWVMSYGFKLRVRTPKPTLRWKITQAMLMKYKLVRFNLHVAGIK